jgi:glycosyltransferase involved in cell wall biosynthesis
MGRIITGSRGGMQQAIASRASVRPDVEPLAICHVLWSVEIGGAERVVLDLAKMQRAAGHRVAVVTLSNPDGALASELRRVVNTLESVPKRPHGTDLTLPLRLARWFRAHGTQVVHTHNELPLIYGAPAGKLARAVVVHSKHGIVPVSRGAHWLRRAAASAADLFVAVSAATADTASANRECAPEKLRVVVNGTDLSRFPAPEGTRATMRRELGIPADARAIITIGRLVKEKNHALLLRAVAPLLCDDRRLILVGDGPLRDELSARLREIEKGRYVHMTGARHDVPALLAAADAFVLSSDSEGLPIGLLEAWAAGLPVISTAVGGIPAAVRPGDTGLLVPPGDEGALTAALRRVFDGDEAFGRMAERGRAHALDTYSAEHMADAYFSLYEECRRR